MKPFRLLVALLLVYGALFAQTTIPYRNGNKWGLADVQGQMVMQAKFDSLITSGYGRINGNITTFLNGKKGFIVDGTEVLQPIFDGIAHEKGILVAYKQTAAGREIYLFNENGHDIINGPVADVKAHDRMGGTGHNIHFFHIVKKDLTQSLFTYNAEGEGTPDYLLKDVYSIAYNRGQEGYVLLRVRQKEDAPVELKRVTFNRTKGIFEDFTGTYMPEGYVIEHAYEADFRDNTMGIEADPGDPVADFGGYGTGSYAGDISISAGSDRYEGPAKKRKTVNFKKDGNVLKVITQAGNGKQQSAVAGFQPGQFTVQYNYQGSIANGDTLYRYHASILYKNKGKWGVYLGQDNFKPTEFDTITGVKYYDGRESNTSFIVGNLNKAKQYVYGIMRFDGTMAVPLQYDDIKVYNRNGSSSLNYFVVKQGKKYGALNPDGTTVLATEYDAVNQPAPSIPGLFFLETTQAGKRGFYALYKEQAVVLPPVLNYRILKVLDYATATGDKSGAAKLLIVLTDNEGRLAGYADETGKLYFKD
jgi:hypothetical protein